VVAAAPTPGGIGASLSSPSKGDCTALHRHRGPLLANAIVWFVMAMGVAVASSLANPCGCE
jgi:hypothetical protein